MVQLIKMQFFFKNCINRPTFNWNGSSTQIIDVIPPPEIHLMLRTGHTLFNAMHVNIVEIRASFS